MTGTHTVAQKPICHLLFHHLILVFFLSFPSSKRSENHRFVRPFFIWYSVHQSNNNKCIYYSSGCPFFTWYLLSVQTIYCNHLLWLNFLHLIFSLSKQYIVISRKIIQCDQLFPFFRVVWTHLDERPPSPPCPPSPEQFDVGRGK